MNKHCCPHPLCPLKGTANVAANDNNPEFHEDVIRTASEIARYLYGDASLTRRVYHLAESTNFPIFRIGSILCIRRSIVDKWTGK